MAQFIHADLAFDPEAVAVMSAAYDKAIDALYHRGEREIVREVVAKRIIHLARNGERDPDRLCGAALAAVGLHPDWMTPA